MIIANQKEQTLVLKRTIEMLKKEFTFCELVTCSSCGMEFEQRGHKADLSFKRYREGNPEYRKCERCRTRR